MKPFSYITNISTKLDICVYKYKEGNIYEGLLQSTYLVIINYLIGFFAENEIAPF